MNDASWKGEGCVEEGEKEEQVDHTSPFLRLQGVLDRAQSKLRELDERRPHLKHFTEVEAQQKEDLLDLTEPDTRSSVEVKGTTSNRLFKLLNPDEEEEDDKKVQGLDSDSKRSVEIRRIQAMKRKRRRRRVTDAAETSLASHLLSQKLSVTASTSIYGSGRTRRPPIPLV